MRCALGWFAFNCHAIAYFPANVHKNINLHGGVMKKMFFNAKACLGGFHRQTQEIQNLLFCILKLIVLACETYCFAS